MQSNQQCFNEPLPETMKKALEDNTKYVIDAIDKIGEMTAKRIEDSNSIMRSYVDEKINAMLGPIKVQLAQVEKQLPSRFIDTATSPGRVYENM